MKGRPEEWTLWTSKAQHGVRQHHAAPFIVDCMDFAIAVSKWWELLKSGCSEGNWSAIRKPGPHGLVALLMCMLWWRRAAGDGQRGIGMEVSEGDPLAMWHSVVHDIRVSFDSMEGAADKPKALKRAGTEKGSARETKRFVIRVILALIRLTAS